MKGQTGGISDQVATPHPCAARLSALPGPGAIALYHWLCQCSRHACNAARTSRQPEALARFQGKTRAARVPRGPGRNVIERLPRPTPVGRRDRLLFGRGRAAVLGLGLSVLGFGLSVLGLGPWGGGRGARGGGQRSITGRARMTGVHARCSAAGGNRPGRGTRFRVAPGGACGTVAVSSRGVVSRGAARAARPSGQTGMVGETSRRDCTP